ncbi:NOL1/NOP2/sun family domain-containing protein, putative [Eimeria tenella]|uniref:NOL1/NOP2/sun family domain-containing protein, putative n=1 Tax=Eimeria tenella TaxID=5802 RepID=U6KMM1_EIMTE|nr:NOL1/NOP2/sun family domain-containing protein, putative [Eimeria tenella]CDJ39352.1 NOL1/NOP2/sun family domain-containing protein, putative [Eimeria tenella]|eukprot:XP_013230107.1 NOL1/NOP2/sun family domain-containing protein, putative [Eimeria tenella]
MNAFRVRHLEQALQLYYAPHTTGHLPLDLFLRHYYKCNKSVGSQDKKFITQHIYQIVKWKGLLDHVTPPPASWSSRIRTYFVSDRWKLQTQNEKLPPSTRTSFPPDLFNRIQNAYGTAKAIHICNTLNEEAPTYLRTNTLAITRDRLYNYLLNKGIAVEKSPNSPYALVLPQRQRLGDLPEFHRGYFEIQDEASQLAALKVEVKPGDKVLDYCAGSGGKSLAFGPQMMNKGKIYLHDVRERMLQEAKKRLKRAGITNYTIVEPGNPTLSKLLGAMDWVVCDVPCSGTGALRRNPEMKWKYKDEKLMDFVALQRHIFSSALQYAKPKTGKIVYITCSILDEENVHQAKFFCQKHGLVLTEPPFHSLPTSHGMDGFFCAIFSRP